MSAKLRWLEVGGRPIFSVDFIGMNIFGYEDVYELVGIVRAGGIVSSTDIIVKSTFI